VVFFQDGATALVQEENGECGQQVFPQSNEVREINLRENQLLCSSVAAARVQLCERLTLERVRVGRVGVGHGRSSKRDGRGDRKGE
jgi:hypothetical protein